jgi:hypothetical protein
MNEFEPKHNVILSCYWQPLMQQGAEEIPDGTLTQHQKRVDECYFFQLTDPKKQIYTKVTLSKEMIFTLVEKIKEIESCFEEKEHINLPF